MSFARRHGLLALAVLVMLALLPRQPLSLLHERPFDAYVYAAMADEPRVFTIAPWGYRVLTPWIVHALPLPSARAFLYVTRAALVLAGAALLLYLRRLGHGAWLSLLAVAAFARIGPVHRAVENPFLCEPVALLLELLFLLGVEAGAGVGTLALVGTLGVLSKETFVLLFPLVYLSQRSSVPRRQALVTTSLVAAPAVLSIVVMRLWWAPHLHAVRPALDLDVARLALERLGDSGTRLGLALLLGGLTPLAIAGGLRREARPFLRRYGYLIAALALLPFLAWLNVPSPRSEPFFVEPVRRLSIYVVPLLFPLALLALDRVWPHVVAAPPPRALTPSWAPLGVALVCLALAPIALDRYRRLDLTGHREGALLVAVCRESLRAAGGVERGEQVRLDAEPDEEFVPGETRLRELERIRWFLWDGWGPDTAYGRGPAVMRDVHASLIVPSLEPRDLELSLTLSAAEAVRLDLAAGSIGLAPLDVAGGIATYTVRVPAAALVRGDNLLGLRVPDVAARVRLHALAVRLAPA